MQDLTDKINTIINKIQKVPKKQQKSIYKPTKKY